MLTLPATKAREKEVDEFLSGIRAHLIHGDYRSLDITYECTEEIQRDGTFKNVANGDFCLTATSR